MIINSIRGGVLIPPNIYKIIGENMSSESKRDNFVKKLKNKQAKTSKLIITPNCQTIFIKEGKTHIQESNEIVENNSILKGLLQKNENPIDLLFYLGYILVDEGIDKTLMYCSESLNNKTEERLERLKKKINKYSNSLIMDIYESLSEEEKSRCSEALKKYEELMSDKKEHTI